MSWHASSNHKWNNSWFHLTEKLKWISSVKNETERKKDYSVFLFANIFTNELTDWHTRVIQSRYKHVWVHVFIYVSPAMINNFQVVKVSNEKSIKVTQ